MKKLLLLFILSSRLVSAQECQHPFLVKEKDGSTWIDCVAVDRSTAIIHSIGQIILAGSNAFDTGETLDTKSRNQKAQEANILLQGLVDKPGLFAMVKASETAALSLYIDKLFHNHPKLAIILEYSLSILYITVGIHNHRLQ